MATGKMFLFFFFHESLDGNTFSHTCDFTSDNVGADGLFFFYREEMETLLVSITTSIDTSMMERYKISLK